MKKRFDLDRSFDQLIKIMLKVESIQSTRRKWGCNKHDRALTTPRFRNHGNDDIYSALTYGEKCLRWCYANGGKERCNSNASRWYKL